MNAWEMYAYRCDGPNGIYYSYVTPARRWLDFVGLNHPIVRVQVREVRGAQYYGWIRVEEDEPTMIQHHSPMFNIQFPYGPEAEENLGRGRIVRLEIEEVTDGSDNAG